MTLQFRSFLPRADPGAALPAWLALVLLGAIGVQLWVGVDAVAPAPAAGTVRVARGAPPAVLPVAVPPVIVSRNIFQPPAPGADGAPAANAAIGGATIAGSVAVRGRRMAVVILPGGQSSYLAPGGNLAGWTLIGIDAQGARFRKDGKILTIDFGAPAAVAAPETEEPEAQ